MAFFRLRGYTLEPERVENRRVCQGIHFSPSLTLGFDYPPGQVHHSVRKSKFSVISLQKATETQKLCQDSIFPHISGIHRGFKGKIPLCPHYMCPRSPRKCLLLCCCNEIEFMQ